MIAYLCNHCKKPIDMTEKKCVHIKISYGEQAITGSGKYGSGWDADLCESCFKKICPLIDEYYYGGNKYLVSTDCKDYPDCKGCPIDASGGCDK